MFSVLVCSVCLLCSVCWCVGCVGVVCLLCSVCSLCCVGVLCWSDIIVFSVWCVQCDGVSVYSVCSSLTLCSVVTEWPGFFRETVFGVIGVCHSVTSSSFRNGQVQCTPDGHCHRNCRRVPS